MFVVRGQELHQNTELVCISFPITGVPKYVVQSWTGNISDRLPFLRLFQWFQLIIQNRPSYNENMTNLDDINDIRNGVFAAAQIHLAFDPRDVVILKVCYIYPLVCSLSDPYLATNTQTPNHILDPNDIPPRRGRTFMPNNAIYPTGSRYTLQWLVIPDKPIESVVPNNGDAAFKKCTKKPKPSELLLHYNYGAAAVKCWGRGIDILQNHAKPPRPPIPVPAPVGPSKTTHDRNIEIHKGDQAQASHGAGAGNPTAGAGTGELVESEGQVMWDEDDVMLFFWGNSQAAKERHLKKVQENTQRMEQWREGIPQDSV